MIPLKEEHHLDAPTRLVKQATTTDGFRKHVFHLKEPNTFIAVDCHAAPKLNEWVVIGFTGSEPVLELYEGQDFIGVATVLDLIELTQSEQQ